MGEKITILIRFGVAESESGVNLIQSGQVEGCFKVNFDFSNENMFLTAHIKRAGYFTSHTVWPIDQSVVEMPSEGRIILSNLFNSDQEWCVLRNMHNKDCFVL